MSIPTEPGTYESLLVSNIVIGNLDQPAYETFINIDSKRVYCYGKTDSNLITAKSTLAFNITGV